MLFCISRKCDIHISTLEIKTSKNVHSGDKFWINREELGVQKPILVEFGHFFSPTEIVLDRARLFRYGNCLVGGQFALVKSAYLAQISPVGPSILINWNNPFSNLGMSSELFYCYSIFDKKSCQQYSIDSIDPYQTPRSEASDPSLHCLPMSQK